jgi:hypothetical protein
MNFSSLFPSSPTTTGPQPGGFPTYGVTPTQPRPFQGPSGPAQPVQPSFNIGNVLGQILNPSQPTGPSAMVQVSRQPQNMTPILLIGGVLLAVILLRK